MSTLSQVRQNYLAECEAGVNKHINLELYASYVYMSMSFHFDRDDVALPGFHSLFKESSEKCRDFAQDLMKFQNQRGGRVVLQDIQKPTLSDWGNGATATKAALELEKTLNQSNLDLHEIASKAGDSQMTDWIESNFLTHRVERIKQFGDHVTNLKRTGEGLGEYLFDKKTLG